MQHESSTVNKRFHQSKWCNCANRISSSLCLKLILLWSLRNTFKHLPPVHRLPTCAGKKPGWNELTEISRPSENAVRWSLAKWTSYISVTQRKPEQCGCLKASLSLLQQPFLAQLPCRMDAQVGGWWIIIFFLLLLLLSKLSCGRISTCAGWWFVTLFRPSSKTEGERTWMTHWH